MLNYNYNALPLAASVFRFSNSDFRSDDDALEPFDTPALCPTSRFDTADCNAPGKHSKKPFPEAIPHSPSP